jgi:hypothetical protein
MSGHTAGPLVVGTHFAERQGARTYIPILRPGNDPVPIAVVHRDVDGYGRDEGEATAAFIVTAYNSHADLVKALERCARLISEALPKFNWGKSALDANAIALLNEVPGEVARALATLTARKVG